MSHTRRPLLPDPGRKQNKDAVCLAQRAAVRTGVSNPRRRVRRGSRRLFSWSPNFLWIRRIYRRTSLESAATKGELQTYIHTYKHTGEVNIKRVKNGQELRS
ncbi:hypothetical protein EVAR_94029_1 [Eumeta japonica]|uniref:Uncharacterized protein n=1 Tax=Eumeta variegata TaxID=151549 RepID=A0A4C2ACC0_EUMVA|nr:hypothetical protein EVAR_94029_1 [Eumeta japonica]